MAACNNFSWPVVGGLNLPNVTVRVEVGVELASGSSGAEAAGVGAGAVGLV